MRFFKKQILRVADLFSKDQMFWFPEKTYFEIQNDHSTIKYKYWKQGSQRSFQRLNLEERKSVKVIKRSAETEKLLSLQCFATINLCHSWLVVNWNIESLWWAATLNWTCTGAYSLQYFCLSQISSFNWQLSERVVTGDAGT